MKKDDKEEWWKIIRRQWKNRILFNYANKGEETYYAEKIDNYLNNKN